MVDFIPQARMKTFYYFHLFSLFNLLKMQQIAYSIYISTDQLQLGGVRNTL